MLLYVGGMHVLALSVHRHVARSELMLVFRRYLSFIQIKSTRTHTYTHIPRRTDKTRRRTDRQAPHPCKGSVG
jgi:hypothetical protein